MRSLRLRLLAWLLLPLVTVAIVATAGAYSFLDRRLTSAYDLDLGDIARTLVPYLAMHEGEVRLDLPEIAEAVLRADSSDLIFFVVRDASGRVIAGDSTLVPRNDLRGEEARFWDDQRGGVAIRAVALRTQVAGDPVVVMAAETTHKRERARRDAFVSAMIPAALLLLAGIVAVLFGVQRGLGPLEMLREEIQARTPADLRPVAEDHVVEELRPLVHELNLMLGRLGEAQQTQTRFIANAAHQLRTPVAGLVTQLDLARRAGPEQALHVAHARDGAARLARLAQQILSLAAADPVSNPSARDEVRDLQDVVKERADTWLRDATARGVELEFALEPARFKGDALLVGEMAANVVDNATRYGARNVRIATRTEAASAVLEVTDDGPGIPAEERTRIFERFYRLDKQSTEGSGLGLAIVHEIAQRHGAAVEVSEGADGRGTRFVISFPPP